MQKKKKREYEIRDILGTGLFGKVRGVCVSLTGVYSVRRYCKYAKNSTL